MTPAATRRGRPRSVRPASTAPTPTFLDASPGTGLLACVRCRFVFSNLLNQMLSTSREHRELLSLALAEHGDLTSEIRRLQGMLASQEQAAEVQCGDLRAQAQAAYAKAAALQVALDARRPASGTLATWSAEELAAIRACVTRCRCTVIDALLALETLYPDRVVVLDSAHRSARMAADFQYPCQAADLLVTLVTTYRDLLVAGRPEGEAKRAFGHFKYAATESVLGKRGEDLRTFSYRGEPVLMRKHLKLGNGEKSSTGLRIHFHWDAERQVVVIGHCGAHLDFC